VGLRKGLRDLCRGFGRRGRICDSLRFEEGGTEVRVARLVGLKGCWVGSPFVSTWSAWRGMMISIF
jgi:hypothetical protein